MSEYRVRFEVFEGPLDLLLHLIRKEEVDIYEVNLTKIATEFIDYLNLMRELDLDVAGEFVVMAATLMLIKSRELLPRDKRPEGQGGEEDEAEDPRWELIRQLVEYRKFKDAAGRLQDYEERVDKIYPRIPGRIELPEDKTPRRSEATLLDLLSAVNAVLKRFSSRGGEARDVFEDRWTVSEKIEFLVAVVRERRGIRFTELFDLAATRTEVVVTFLAVLELIRLRLIVAAQSEAFAEIVIDPAPPRADETAAGAGAGNGVEIREGSGEGPAAGDPGRGDGGGNGNGDGDGDGDGALPPVDGDAPPRTELPPDDTHESRWN